MENLGEKVHLWGDLSPLCNYRKYSGIPCWSVPLGEKGQYTQQLQINYFYHSHITGWFPNWQAPSRLLTNERNISPSSTSTKVHVHCTLYLLSKWNIKQILDFFNRNGETDNLSAKGLTLKLAMSWCEVLLTNCIWCRISAAWWNWPSKLDQTIDCIFSWLSSLWRHTLLQHMYMYMYLARTADWRTIQNRYQLFLSINKHIIQSLQPWWHDGTMA